MLNILRVPFNLLTPAKTSIRTMVISFQLSNSKLQVDCTHRALTTTKAFNVYQPKAIWDPNLDFWINPDLDTDVCWIAAKML